MAYEQRDNSGILFRNDGKSRETDRDYGGSATIAGVEYWISAWIKESKTGTKFLSFRFKPKREEKATAKAGGGVDYGGDEIPFMPERR